MSKLNKEERLVLTRQMLEHMTADAHNLADLCRLVEHPRDTVRIICRKLVAQGILQIDNKRFSVVVSASQDTNSLLKALGYRQYNIPEPVDCIDCGDAHIQILLENGKLVGDDGRCWKGNQCPDCRAESICKTEPIQMTTRKCRGCSAFLPATRYFKCHACEPVLSDLDGDYIYSPDVYSTDIHLDFLSTEESYVNAGKNRDEHS